MNNHVKPNGDLISAALRNLFEPQIVPVVEATATGLDAITVDAKLQFSVFDPERWEKIASLLEGNDLTYIYDDGDGRVDCTGFDVEDLEQVANDVIFELYPTLDGIYHDAVDELSSFITTQCKESDCDDAMSFISIREKAISIAKAANNRLPMVGINADNVISLILDNLNDDVDRWDPFDFDNEPDDRRR